MAGLKARLHEFSLFLGAADFSHRRAPVRFFFVALRSLVYAAKKFRRDHGIEQGAALSFISLVSLIPVGFLFLFFLRAFGLLTWWTDLKAGILQNFVPESQESIKAWLGVFEQDPLSTISSIPYYVLIIAGLIVSALWLFEASEKALSRIWATGRGRTYVQRLTVFWLMVTASPFLLTLSTYLKSEFERNPHFKELMQETVLLETFYGFFVPFAIATLAFFFVYLLLPAARVQIVPALWGAAFAGLFWELAKSVLAYVVPRALTFSVYGSLGAVATFLFWFYISWVVLLFGAQLSFVIQKPREAVALLTKHGADPRLPPGFLALAAAVEIARVVGRGDQPPSLAALAETWSVREDVLRREVLTLAPRVFHRTASDEDVYFLTGDSDRLRVGDILGSPPGAVAPSFTGQETTAFLADLRAAIDGTLGDLTVRDILNRNFSLRYSEAHKS